MRQHALLINRQSNLPEPARAKRLHREAQGGTPDALTNATKGVASKHARMKNPVDLLDQLGGYPIFVFHAGRCRNGIHTLVCERPLGIVHCQEENNPAGIVSII
jgi:hypothetical protein